MVALIMTLCLRPLLPGPCWGKTGLWKGRRCLSDRTSSSSSSSHVSDSWLSGLATQGQCTAPEASARSQANPGALPRAGQEEQQGCQPVTGGLFSSLS